jgi:hypothetical protein
MNILTIGIDDGVSSILNNFQSPSSEHHITHLCNKDEAINTIRDESKSWDWIIIQGHDDPGHWKSILCAVNANATNTPITVLSSHIDGTRLRTPVCSMHNNGDNMTVSRCAMQSLLENEKRPLVGRVDDETTPIVFEYHSPCR